MHKKGILGLIGFFLVVLAAGFFIFLNYSDFGGDGEGKIIDDRKEECIRVQTTCCPCNEGGEEKCVLKENAEIERVNLSECPSEDELVCPQVYNCEISNCVFNSSSGECVSV